MKNCHSPAAGTKDLDPQRIGGWSSYPYEVALCEPHSAAIDAGVDWVCRDQEDGSSGWLVLVGDQIKSLEKYTVKSVGAITSGSVNWRSNGVLPSGMHIPIEVQQVGNREPSTIGLYINPDQARRLIDILKLHIRTQER